MAQDLDLRTRMQTDYQDLLNKLIESSISDECMKASYQYIQLEIPFVVFVNQLNSDISQFQEVNSKQKPSLKIILCGTGFMMSNNDEKTPNKESINLCSSSSTS